MSRLLFFSFYIIPLHVMSLIFLSLYNFPACHASYFSLFIQFPCMSCLILFIINYLFFLSHFCAWQFPFFPLLLLIHLISMHVISLIFLSLYNFPACHVSYFSLLTIYFFYFTFVHDNSLFFSSSYHWFIWFPCMSCFLIFFLNCLFHLFHLHAWQFCHYSRFLWEDFNFISMHIMYIFFLIVHFLYFESVYNIFLIFLASSENSFILCLCM
jgi:hypothetical protein